MKYVIVLIGILIGLNCNAQSNFPIYEATLDTVAIQDRIERKKAKDIIVRQCIKIDTVITQLKEIKAMNKEIIAKLKERKRLNGGQ